MFKTVLLHKRQIEHNKNVFMGLDIALISKFEEPECRRRYLSRHFCTLLIGEHSAHTTIEFKQLQDLLQIDISLLQQQPSNIEPDIEYLEFELYSAEEEGGTIKMAHIQAEIRKAEEEWKESYDKINEGWTKVTELRAKIQEFIKKIEAYPDFWKKMNFNLPWENYFSTEAYLKNKDRENKIVNHYLLEDLNSILDYLDCVEPKGHEYVAFVFR